MGRPRRAHRSGLDADHRIVNSAIDGVAGEMAAVRADIVSHAGSDLLCYRAEGPRGLVEAQDAAWSPLVSWAKDALGARFILAEGVMPVKQDDQTLAAIARAVEGFGPLALAALHTVTTLTGSAIIALRSRGRITPDEAWAAAHVDEDWQMKKWGGDTAAHHAGWRGGASSTPQPPFWRLSVSSRRGGGRLRQRAPQAAERSHGARQPYPDMDEALLEVLPSRKDQEGRQQKLKPDSASRR